MKKLTLKTLMSVALLSLTATTVFAAESKTYEMPKPGPEQAWLQQFVGKWTSDTEAIEPGKAPIHIKGSETITPLGGFWTVSEIKSTMMNEPFTGQMTLGYDSAKKKYIGTWVDSMTGKLWNYEGSVDAAGKALTLESEGACPMNPGKMTKFKEVIELQDKDHKLFTSTMLGDDGKWVTVMSSKAVRVK